MLFSAYEIEALVRGFGVEGDELRTHLPNPHHVGTAAYAGQLVDGLRRRGMVGPGLFAELRRRRPRLVAAINRVSALWGFHDDDPDPPSPQPPSPTFPGAGMSALQRRRPQHLATSGSGGPTARGAARVGRPRAATLRRGPPARPTASRLVLFGCLRPLSSELQG